MIKTSFCFLITPFPGQWPRLYISPHPLNLNRIDTLAWHMYTKPPHAPHNMPPHNIP